MCFLMRIDIITKNIFVVTFQVYPKLVPHSIGVSHTIETNIIAVIFRKFEEGSYVKRKYYYFKRRSLRASLSGE